MCMASRRFNNCLEKKVRKGDNRVHSGKKRIDLEGRSVGGGVPELSPQTQLSEGRNSLHNADSNDSSMYNSVEKGGVGTGGDGFVRVEDKVQINLLAARSKGEVNELRTKLVGELERVRSFVKKLEAKGVWCNGFSEANEGTGKVGSALQVNSEVGSVGQHELGAVRGCNVSIMDNGGGNLVEKKKVAPKAKQHHRDSDLVLGKEKSHPPKSSKKLRSNGVAVMKPSDQVFKRCSSLLTKLMKHKHAWVFNKPVNAEALGLHDYHTIIKRPMDLGTVKNMLNKNWYKSPKEFAEDVRLTFRNAMAYNPKEQDVHIMAKQLLDIFEEQWAAIEAEYIHTGELNMGNDVMLHTPSTNMASPPPPLQMRALDGSESLTTHVDSTTKKAPSGPANRTPVGKSLRPEETHRMEMTYEEKQRLSMKLQNLPPEKVDGVVDIIKRRNAALCQEDDEIEIDIDSVDAETLCELDRYVSNCEMSLKNNKRKAETAFET